MLPSMGLAGHPNISAARFNLQMDFSVHRQALRKTRSLSPIAVFSVFG